MKVEFMVGDSTILKDLLSAVYLVSDEVSIKTEDDGLRLFAVDYSKVAAIDVKISSGFFEEFLVEEKGFPASLIAIEKGLTINGKPRRFDAVAYNNNGEPLVLMEFKAASVNLTQKVFEQIATYNQLLKVKYLIVSNGLKHYCCEINFTTQSIRFLKEIPEYGQLL